MLYDRTNKSSSRADVNKQNTYVQEPIVNSKDEASYPIQVSTMTGDYNLEVFAK